jgi:hypothetical protein
MLRHIATNHSGRFRKTPPNTDSAQSFLIPRTQKTLPFSRRWESIRYSLHRRHFLAEEKRTHILSLCLLAVSFLLAELLARPTLGKPRQPPYTDRRPRIADRFADKLPIAI